MAGLDHKRADLRVREKFSVTGEKSRCVLSAIKDNGNVGGCVVISTCNRTELYASVRDSGDFEPSQALCASLGRDYGEFGHFFTERTGRQAMEHLCRVASGLDSQILGDDQVITQVREALELSRGQNCTDSYIETMFKLAVQSAKAIKTNVALKSLGTGSVPRQAVEKLKGICPLTGRSAVVIGNGKMGRLVSELLLAEGMRVTVTLREYKKGNLQIPEHAETVNYSQRYAAIEKADIVVSATTSPHFTICCDELLKLARLPEVIVDLAVPRDVELSARGIPGVTLFTIDEITDEKHDLPLESLHVIEEIIAEHVEKYYKWATVKEGTAAKRAGSGRFFPLFIDMQGRKALVLGGGNIAQRRTKILADFGADITVISPVAGEYIERASASGAIIWLKREYEEGDLADFEPFLLVAATDSRKANHAAMEEAAGLGILVSVADHSGECSCFFPAIAESDAFVAGLISKNGDHGSVKQMAERLRGLLDQ